MSLVLTDVTIAIAERALISGLNLSIAGGETVTLMGPSGSGKSSLLAYLAGDLPEALQGRGRVEIDGQAVNDLPPEARRIGRLFQDDLLFPHMTVISNLLFGMPRGTRRERIARAAQALHKAGLEGMGERLPHTLSGGQRARVSLLRAILAQPRALLLDEPFSKLDQALRGQMRKYVFDRVADEGIPALLVTHDPQDVPPQGRVLSIERSGRVRHA
jgi:putative thiamine transport system ATP-binding protein